MRASSIVLLSGGLDSLASFHWALQNTDVVRAITFDYGQHACRNEVDAAARISRKNDVRHEVIQLDWFAQMPGVSALIGKEVSIPDMTAADLDDAETTKGSAKAVWVPNRNGVFLNIAAAIAESRLVGQVIVGFNKEEAATFPDNSEDFLKAMNRSLEFSTKGPVKIAAPMSGKNKIEIARWLKDAGADLTDLWSCYRDGDKMCGRCESCARCKRALSEVGLADRIGGLFENAAS